jgi:HlyD family secretion protein
MKKFFARFRRRTWIIIGVVAAVLVTLLLVFRGGGNDPASAFQTEKVARGTLTATIGATGSVRAQRTAMLIWQTAGSVDQVSAKVGDRVSRGEVLASLDKRYLSQNIILAQADLLSAQKALDDLMNSGTARAQAAIALDQAEKDYKKAYDYRQSLNGKITITEVTIVRGIPRVREYKGFADEETIADADEKLALALATLEDAQRDYERVKNGPSPEDVSAAQARVDAALSTLSMAIIIAPFDGTVTQAGLVPGEQVIMGDTAFRLDDLSHLLVDVQISEVDINNINPDQEAILTFDAILDKEYHGKVMEVGQAGDTVQGVVNFTVTIELTDADELVKPGMTAAVNIVMTELNDVLLVPNRAVRSMEGERVVYVLREQVPVPVKVELGQSSETMSIVLDGELKEGDLVILNPPAQNFGPFGG